MKNVFIIHSYNGDTEYSFAPSVEKLCKENNIDYYFPKFPIRSEATYEGWENILKRFQPTDNKFKKCQTLVDNIYSIYSDNDEPIEFIISIDNRNIRVGELNNLETYLKTEFCIYDDDFKITYYDSKTNYGIQLADLTVNTFYNSYKNISLV